MTVAFRICPLFLAAWMFLSLTACLHIPDRTFRAPPEVVRGQISFLIATPGEQIAGDAAIAISSSGETRVEILNPFDMTSALLMIDNNSLKWFDFTNRCYSASSNLGGITLRELGFALTGGEIWRWLGMHPWPEERRRETVRQRNGRMVVLSWVGPDAASLGGFILELPPRGLVLKLNWVTREMGTMEVFEQAPDRSRFKRCGAATMQLFPGRTP